MAFLNCCKNLNRKKPLEADYLSTSLRRCLGIFDLTMLGVSGMLGAGLYVLTGAVAKDTSGPAVILSYLAAAIAAFLSALCYAEFGAKIPSTGSSYIFTYVTMGELWGFLMGWNMVLEHGVGSASVAKAWSGYLDSVLGYPIKTYLSQHLPLESGPPLGEYVDLVGAAIILLLCAFVATGAQSSTRFNMVFALINIAVVVFIITTGVCLSDIRNWTKVEGGFIPFGFSGVIAGASRCFFAFAGFDVIASSCEEARNPKRDIPIALAISLLIATLSYVGVSSVLTLMVPWNDIVPRSAIPDAYGRHDGWQWAQVIVTVGSLCTMTTSMFSGLFVMPRILYAISKDGLLCPLLSDINERTQVPLASVGFTALLCSLMALLFDLETLVQFMSIGTLTAYSFVAACVVLLRYGAVGEISPLVSSPSSSSEEIMEKNKLKKENEGTTTEIYSSKSYETLEKKNVEADDPQRIKSLPAAETTSLMRKAVNGKNPSDQDRSHNKEVIPITSNNLQIDPQPGKLKPIYEGTRLDRFLGQYPAGRIVLLSLLLAVISSSVGMILLLECWNELINGCWWTILILILSTMTTGISIVIICAHQQQPLQSDDQKSFKVPLVPFVPFLCICTNIFFMLKLQEMTWIRLLIWISVGLLIYFTYGYHHSQLNPKRNDERVVVENTPSQVWLKTKKIISNFFKRNENDRDRLIPEESDLE